MTTVNLDRIQSWIDQGRLSCNRPITLKELYKSGCIERPIDGVKILGDGASNVKQAMYIIASRASASAIAAIEAAGGVIQTRYYTPSSIRRIIAGDMHTCMSYQWSMSKGPRRTLFSDATLESDRWARLSNYNQEKYRLPDPTKRRDIEYYRDPAHRGYLSRLLKPREGPSLFFRSSEERKSAAGTKKVKVLPENRLW